MFRCLTAHATIVGVVVVVPVRGCYIYILMFFFCRWCYQWPMYTSCRRSSSKYNNQFNDRHLWTWIEWDFLWEKFPLEKLIIILYFRSLSCLHLYDIDAFILNICPVLMMFWIMIEFMLMKCIFFFIDIEVLYLYRNWKLMNIEIWYTNF